MSSYNYVCLGKDQLKDRAQGVGEMHRDFYVAFRGTSKPYSSYLEK